MLACTSQVRIDLAGSQTSLITDTSNSLLIFGE